MSQTLAELLVAVGIDTEALTSGASGAADEVESTLGGINTAAAGAAAGGLFMAGLSNAMDASTANTKLTNQLGLTQAEAQKAGDSAGRVFSSGFGESIDGVNEALGAVAQNMGGMSAVSGDALDQMTKDAITLSDTFEFDVGASAQAAGTLVKTGLAKNGTEAFDLITAAAQKLPPALREELPDVINEYGTFFDQLGFTGPDMMGLLTQAAKNPTFQVDKLGDAFKEFTLRLADTKNAEGPLKALHLNVKDIQKEVNTGHGTKAFDEVATALKGVKDQTKRTALQAALFGGPGEDMGDTLLNLHAGGAAAATGMNKASGAAKKVTDSVAASKSIDSIWRTMTTTIGDQLAPALKVFSDFMKDNPGLVKILAPAILILATALGIAAIAQWAMNSAMLANPVFWIIAGIIALVAIILIIATKTTWFQQLWAAVWGAIKSAALAVWGALKSAFMTYINFYITLWNVVSGALTAAWNATWNAIKTAASTVWSAIKAVVMLNVNAVKTGVTTVLNAIKAVFNKVWGWIKTFVGSQITAVKTAVSRLSALPGQVGAYFQRMKDAAVGKVSALISYVRGIGGKVRGAIGNLGSLLHGVGRSIVQGLINGVTGMISSLKQRFSSITSMIPDWKGPMTLDLKLLTPSGEAVMGGFMDGIDHEVPALHRQLGNITSEIPANVNVSTARASSSDGQAGREPARAVIDVTGAEGPFKTFIQNLVRIDGQGSVQTAFGQRGMA